MNDRRIPAAARTARIARVLGLALWAVAAAPAAAHEIEAHRMTLVLREPRHVSMTLFVDYPRLLHRVLAPQMRFEEFAVMHAAMKTDELAAALRRAHAQVESGIRVTAADGAPLRPGGWTWPTTQLAQQMLQRTTMRALVGAAAGDHDAPAEVRAEATAARDIGSLRVELPDALRPTLVVAYRPRQGWLQRGAPALKVEFR